MTGRPVLHSLSPQIFNFWFRADGQDAVYTRLAAGSAGQAVKTAKAMGLAGLNITAPYKEDVPLVLDGADVHALRIGAANCAIRRGRELWGYNTDFVGAVAALTENGIDPGGRRIAILGAGGAACAAAYGLKRSRAASVTLLNRSEGRAKSASARIGCDYAPLERAEQVMLRSDILVACIPPGSTLDAVRRLNKRLVVLQADYRPLGPRRGSSFRQQILISGLQWLLYQAVPAYRLFTGRKLSSRLVKLARESLLGERPRAKANIALVGFMGSGKTTVGRMLSKKMGWGLIDSDAEIEKQCGMTVPDIFRELGEPVFRAKEKALVKARLPAARKKIFSLGGGALLDPETRSLVAEHCLVVWLWVSLAGALGRIDLSTRPVLGSSHSERAAERAFQVRVPGYARASDLVLDAEAAPPQELAGRLCYEMDQTFGD